MKSSVVYFFFFPTSGLKLKSHCLLVCVPCVQRDHLMDQEGGGGGGDGDEEPTIHVKRRPRRLSHRAVNTVLHTSALKVTGVQFHSAQGSLSTLTPCFRGVHLISSICVQTA